MTEHLGSVGLGAGPLLASQPVQGDPGGFQPVEGGGATRSGELLLVEAYAVIWLVAFAFLLLSVRRQRRLEARLEQLESAIAQARQAQDDGAEG